MDDKRLTRIEVIFNYKEVLYYVNRNFRDLEYFVNYYSEEELMKNLQDDKFIVCYQQNFSRLVCNFVSSAKTMVEFMRENGAYLMSENFEENKEYKQRKDAFEAPLPQFIEGCRNLLVHHGLPPKYVHYDFNFGEKFISTKIDKEYFNNHYIPRQPKLQQYLKEQEDIDMWEACKDYYKLFVDFHDCVQKNIL